MGHSAAALAGLLVGILLLALQSYLKTAPTPPTSRNLASNSTWRQRSLPALWPGPPQGTLKIRTLRQNNEQVVFQFALEIVTTGWVGLAIAANNSIDPEWKNFMTGPPVSCAVVGTYSNTVGFIYLDGMPPTNQPDPALLSDNGVTAATLTRTKNKDGTTMTTLQFTVANFFGIHPLHDTCNFLYAYGLDEHLDFQYHTPARRGVLLNINLHTFGTDGGTFNARAPFYELHGGFLAFIWSVTTLLGGVIARYCRSWAGWIDAHQFLQTVATVLSFPLTLLSYAAKDGTGSHYISFHGIFGLVFSLTATAQGMLGSYAHAAFAHECGLVTKRPKVMAKCRQVHRTVGKCMLVVASMQILLGLYSYNPNFYKVRRKF